MSTIHYETVAAEIEDLNRRFAVVTELKHKLDEALKPMIDRVHADNTRTRNFNIGIYFNAKITSRTVSICIEENASAFKVGQDTYIKRQIDIDFHYTKSLKYFNITDLGFRTPSMPYWANFVEPIKPALPAKYLNKIKFKNFDDVLPIIVALFEPELNEDGYKQAQMNIIKTFKKTSLRKEATLKRVLGGKDSALL